MVKVCRALAHTKSGERIGEARALSWPKLCGRIRDGSYGCVAPKLCGQFGDGSYGFAVPKLCTIERTGQEAAAKIGVILALRG